MSIHFIVKCEQPRHWSNHAGETDRVRERTVVVMDNNLRNFIFGVLVLAHKQQVKCEIRFQL